MPYHVEITAKALREIDESLEWYAVRSLRTSVQWYVNLMEAVRDLGDNPERFELAPENEWCRCLAFALLRPGHDRVAG